MLLSRPKLTISSARLLLFFLGLQHLLQQRQPQLALLTAQVGKGRASLALLACGAEVLVGGATTKSHWLSH